MLHGFRKLAEIANILEDVPGVPDADARFRRKWKPQALESPTQKDLPDEPL